MRHGEALSNKKNIVSSWPEKRRFPLTLEGKKKIKNTVKKLKNKNIDLIFSSDVLRSRQTAEIVGKELKIKPKYDKRLREINVGILNGKSGLDFVNFFKGKDRFKVRAPKGENYADVQKRMFNFIKYLEKRYSGKNILIVSHQAPLDLLKTKVKGFSNEEFFKKISPDKKIKTGEFNRLIFK